jgi:hypothetical protein
MLELGSTVARFEGTFESAWDIIERITVQYPVDAIRLQEEMVDLQLPLGKTEVGSALYNMRQNYLAKQREAILKLLKEAEAENNEMLVHELTAEYNIIQGDLQYGFGDYGGEDVTTKGNLLSRIRWLMKLISVRSLSLCT